MKKLLLVVLAGIALAACGPHQLSEAERQVAELGARDYSERSGGSYIGCSGQDSNNDNYVTCTMADKASKQMEIVCSYAEGARGCKLKD